MKKVKVGDISGRQLEELNKQASRGQISRRYFVSQLLRLGASLPLAGVMANAWSSSDRLSDEYDYIIVGAGSAGCVMADRISAGAMMISGV